MSRSITDLAAAMAAAWSAGKPEQVIALAGQAPAAAAEDEGVLAWLGLAQQVTARHAQAAATFRRLTRMRPQVSAYWNNLGVACRLSGDTAASERALLKAGELAPDDAEVHYNLGLLYLQLRHWPRAREALLDAVRLSPRFIDARLQAAYACHVCGDNGGEEAMLEGAAGWPPQPAGQALILAAMLSTLGRPDAALRTLAQARLPEGAAAEPMRLRIIAERVALYERSNQVERARRELQQLPVGTLEALPPDADQARSDGLRAHAVLAMRARQYADAAALYRRVLDLAADDESRANAAFGLASALDRQGQYHDAWQAAQIAHAAQLGIARTIVPELLAPDSQPLPMADRIVGQHAHAAWRPLPSPNVDESPVFVVGFPRSGTTLLEQMLDAHPAFRSMDERAYIHDLVERMQAVGQRYPDDLADLSPTDADQLRAVYWRLVRRVLPDLGQHRLVDKNPLNMLCLPMILRLFPRTRIILCLRHPCDVLLSCSMQPFRSPAFMVLCSSPERLARGYARVFEQWQRHIEVFKPDVLTWRYESVVTGFEDQIVQLGDYLGLADASPMLRFAEHARGKRFISTPSYAQVTEPVHHRAVGRWEAYRERFEPVLPILRPWIERFGYAV